MNTPRDEDDITETVFLARLNIVEGLALLARLEELLTDKPSLDLLRGMVHRDQEVHRLNARLLHRIDDRKRKHGGKP